MSNATDGMKRARKFADEGSLANLGARARASASLIEARTTALDPSATDLRHGWIGLEPTFSDARTVRRWRSLSAKKHGEDRFFEHERVLAKLRDVARSIAKHYRARRKKDDPACVFADVEVERGVDQWKVERRELRFTWDDRDAEPFEVRVGLDPETYEFGIKPVPIAWFYDERFVRFLERFVWSVSERQKLVPSMAHGGGQFSMSAKSWLGGSLLADDIAHRLDHPELASWICDYPNPDDRAFRATARRARAFRDLIDAYWRGAFHPRAAGVPTVESAYLDRGFEPAPNPPPGLVHRERGPVGNAIEVFQTNFAFGRAVRLRAQSIDPGYWQSQHPDEDGYRPDQIMRYSEGNLNRLQIAGEWHVKSGKVLDEDDIRELELPLEPSMLYDEASWEIRAQMSKTSARDMVEAVLLDVHHAMWLCDHPHPAARASLAQDRLLGDAERTLAKRAPKVLDRLHGAARAENLEASRGRMKTDWIEPEDLFWAAWRALPSGARAEIALEAITGFVERVENAASADPRSESSPEANPKSNGDPMEWHRHRVHPELWRALEESPGSLDRNHVVRREHAAWTSRGNEYLARRPIWSPTGEPPPWEEGAL